jgi:hypothetical protein
MLGPEAVPSNDTRFTHRATSGSVRDTESVKKGVQHPFLRTRERGFSARPVEAQFDYAGGDLAGAVAAGVARDVEFGGEGVETALGSAL